MGTAAPLSQALHGSVCTYRLNWARRTSGGWWDEWDHTSLQTQDSKFWSRATIFCETQLRHSVKTRLCKTPPPHTSFCETQWRHSVKTRLCKTPSPILYSVKLIVLARSVTTKEVKVIEFHRIESLQVSGKETWRPERGRSSRSPIFHADSCNPISKAPSSLTSYLTHELAGRYLAVLILAFNYFK